MAFWMILSDLASAVVGHLHTFADMSLQVASDQQSSDSSARVERAVAQARSKMFQFPPAHFPSPSITLHHIHTVPCKCHADRTLLLLQPVKLSHRPNNFHFQFLAWNRLDNGTFDAPTCLSMIPLLAPACQSTWVVTPGESIWKP